jgi:hypothetical protein
MAAPTTHFIDPAGSVLSTGADMAAYMRFLLNGGRSTTGALISPQSYALLTSPGVTDGHELGDDQPGMYHRYGYGLAIMNVGGDKVLAHTGGVISYTACMMVDVTRGFGVVALTNLGYVGPRPCPIVSYAIQTLQAQAKGKGLPPIPPVKDAARVINASDYAGTYASPSGEIFSVTATGDRLTLVHAGSSYPLYPRGEGVFWSADAAFNTFGLQFGRNKNGEIVDASSGPQWFTNARYSGPRRFSYPAAWNSFIGKYEAMDPNGYYSSLHVYVLKGRLMADGTPLQPLHGRLFHVGGRTWEPAWIRFEERITGKTQIVAMPGETLYRVQPY